MRLLSREREKARYRIPIRRFRRRESSPGVLQLVLQGGFEERLLLHGKALKIILYHLERLYHLECHLEIINLLFLTACNQDINLLLVANSKFFLSEFIKAMSTCRGKKESLGNLQLVPFQAIHCMGTKIAPEKLLKNENMQKMIFLKN